MKPQMTSTNTRVALIQMSCVPDTQINLDKAAERVYEAARQGATLVCLPELFRAQYFCQREDHGLFDLAESIPGPSTDVLTRVCREANVVLVASLFERRAPGLYHNTAVTIEHDGRIEILFALFHCPLDRSDVRVVELRVETEVRAFSVVLPTMLRSSPCKNKVPMHFV